MCCSTSTARVMNLFSNSASGRCISRMPDGCHCIIPAAASCSPKPESASSPSWASAACSSCMVGMGPAAKHACQCVQHQLLDVSDCETHTHAGHYTWPGGILACTTPPALGHCTACLTQATTTYTFTHVGMQSVTCKSQTGSCADP